MKLTRTIPSVVLLATLCLLPGSARAAEDLPHRARAAFERYCFECHGRGGSDEGGMNYVLDLPRLVQAGKVKPKDSAHSRIVVRLKSKDDPMPPSEKKGADRPDAATIAMIEQWIDAGAAPIAEVAADKEKPREYISNAVVIAAIHGHLRRLDPEDRPYQRYFTLHHLNNLPPDRVPAVQLKSVRAATAKVLNSLSWRSDIVVPQPLDAAQTVLAFDMRDVDWDADHAHNRQDLWLHMVSKYPYGLKHNLYPDDRGTRDMAEEIYQWTGVDIPWVRADWFVATASQPPLYHTLLYDAVFPDLAKRPKVKVKLANGDFNIEPLMTAKDLEGWLRVNVAGNIRRDKAARAGFTKSGVSAQPRMVERHPALYGGYWKSYDFKGGNLTLNLQIYPLGPPGVLHEPRLKPFEFKQDGGEVVFHLPNGLNGYLLVDGQDKRINVGPSEVVEDSSKTIGNSQIVTGLSCIACHKMGIKREFSDTVRFGVTGLPAQGRDKVRKLYLDPPDMVRLIEKDESRFARALEECIGPIVRTGPDDKRETSALDEPVGAVAKRYLGQELDLSTLAYELDQNKSDDLGAAIKFNPGLREAGLAGVPAGGTLKRETLEGGSGLTVYQQAARQLKIGTPVKISAPE